MYGQPGVPGYVPPSGSTAKTLILVGLILQAIFVLFGLGYGALITLVVPFFGIFYIAVAALGIVWLLLVWLFSYRPVSEHRYEAARTWTLIVAILSIITLLSLIPGILYLIAYIKLGDAVREQQMPPPGYPGGAPMMPGASPYAVQPASPYAAQPGAPMQPQAAPVAAPPAAPAAPAPVICPKCGRPATFIPQYNRYYCYTDQQYV